MGATQGLDGLGLLAACSPTPTGVAVIKANVIVNGTPSLQYLLAISTPSGCHVTYWTEEALIKLRNQITTELTGIVIASETPHVNGDGYGD